MNVPWSIGRNPNERRFGDRSPAKNTSGRTFIQRHAGFESPGRLATHLSRRKKAAKGQYDKSHERCRWIGLALLKAGAIPSARPKLSGPDSGTPPRKRPVTHDRVPRTTVAGANDVSRLRRGVAPKTARAQETTLKRDAPKVGRLRKECGLGWITLKGNKSRREAPVDACCDIRIETSSTQRADWRAGADRRLREGKQAKPFRPVAALRCNASVRSVAPLNRTAVKARRLGAAAGRNWAPAKPIGRG